MLHDNTIRLVGVFEELSRVIQRVDKDVEIWERRRRCKLAAVIERLQVL